MAGQLTTADVYLWGTPVGSVTWDPAKELAHFTYSDQFLSIDIDAAPLTMPRHRRHFAFPELNANVFRGLPGFLADSLPDKFGNAVIDAWVEHQGWRPDCLDPVERLLLIGTRGMGALEYLPNPAKSFSVNHFSTTEGRGQYPLDLPTLIELINMILCGSYQVSSPESRVGLADTLNTLFQIGISADGSRAKAVVAWNPGLENVLPGDLVAPEGADYWLIKFDGITDNKDKEASDPQGWGLIEYAYYLMAKAAGIELMECRLLHENGRRHFITRRFDRTHNGEKIHRQSLCAMGHMDFDAAGAYSYEEALRIMQNLGMHKAALEEQFRRMVFNVVARNHDDHPKNIAFLMDRHGEWSLSPAYDLTFAYNPQGHWTNRHQMSINGKRDNFALSDFHDVARRFALPRELADAIIQQVTDAVVQWPLFAEPLGIEPGQLKEINTNLRLNIT